MNQTVLDRDDDSWLSSDVPSNYVCPQDRFDCNASYKRPLEFENSPLGVALTRRSKTRRKKQLKETGSVPLRQPLQPTWISPDPTLGIAGNPVADLDEDWKGRKGKRRTGKLKKDVQDMKGKQKDRDFGSRPRYCELEMRTRGQPRVELLHSHIPQPKPHFIWKRQRSRQRPPPEILVEDTPPVD